MSCSSLLCCSEESESLDNISPSSASDKSDVVVAHKRCDGSSLMDFGLLSRATSREDGRRALRELRDQEGAFMADHARLARLSESARAYRRRAVGCILDVCQRLRYHDSTSFAAVNLFDRFLAAYKVPSFEKQEEEAAVAAPSAAPTTHGGGGEGEEAAWVFPLIAAASVSIAAKMNEVLVPSLFELTASLPTPDVGVPLDHANVRRMEMGILSMLGWRVNCITPCTVLPYHLRELQAAAASYSSDHDVDGGGGARDKNTSSSKKEGGDDDREWSRADLEDLYASSVRLMRAALRDVDYAGFAPSEIASAALGRALELRAGRGEGKCATKAKGGAPGASRKRRRALDSLMVAQAHGDGEHGARKRPLQRSLSPATPLDLILDASICDDGEF